MQKKKGLVENISDILLRELYLNICSEVYFKKELVQKYIYTFEDICDFSEAVWWGKEVPSLRFKAPKILDRPHLLYRFCYSFYTLKFFTLEE
jgi:hypothetical protein